MRKLIRIKIRNNREVAMAFPSTRMCWEVPKYNITFVTLEDLLMYYADWEITKVYARQLSLPIKET